MNNDTFIYALKERIGNPDLFVGRQKELKFFLSWVGKIEQQTAKSRALIARRKSGKTAFLQRLFNIIWNQHGKIIPLYFEVQDKPFWAMNFAEQYYETFLSQYFAFKLNNPLYIQQPLAIEDIKQLAIENNASVIIRDIKHYEQVVDMDILFRFVAAAPNRIASVTGDFFLVIIDEFQYMNEYLFWDEQKKNRAEGCVGVYHDLSESKIAPMLVSGSYVGWLRQLILDYFKGGRLRPRELNPRLTTEEGIECVWRYSEITQQSVTLESAIAMNELTHSDPFYISCLFDSDIDDKDLTTPEGVIAVLDNEINDHGSDLNIVWLEYIAITLKQVNDRNAKKIVIFLSKERKKEWTLSEIKSKLKLDLTDNELEEKLRMLIKGDIISEGSSYLKYKGIPDDIFDKIFRSIYQEAIEHFQPDIKTELFDQLRHQINRLRGELNYYLGHMPEFFIALELKRKKKKVVANRYSPLLKDRVENYQIGVEFEDFKVTNEYVFTDSEGYKHEIDILAEPLISSLNPTVLAFEVKNRESKEVTKEEAISFIQKVELIKKHLKNDAVYGVYVSVNGFPSKVRDILIQNHIMYADFQKWFGIEISVFERALNVK